MALHTSELILRMEKCKMRHVLKEYDSCVVPKLCRLEIAPRNFVPAWITELLVGDQTHYMIYEELANYLYIYTGKITVLPITGDARYIRKSRKNNAELNQEGTVWFNSCGIPCFNWTYSQE